MLGCHIAGNELRTTSILNIEAESPTVKTLSFKDELCAKAKPGQFLMLWIPGVDEIPLSILNTEEENIISVAVRRVGEATTALHEKKEGETIGVRGPFGSSFTLSEGRILMVCGGTGAIPILFLAERLVSKSKRLTCIIGANTSEELLFMNRFEKFGTEKMRILATTEDGSHGIEGFATTPLRSLLEQDRFDMIYTCGPDRMMRKVFDLAEEFGIALQASLERLMRCAVGLCGSCVVGKYRVCKDGPVFSSHQLQEAIGEFGRYKNDLNGRKIRV